MEQQRALNALEPYLALTRTATSPRAAADLIAQATSSPTTFVFAELLDAPSIQLLRDSAEYAPHLRLLEIFSWGTWADYQAQQAQLPQLTPAQHEKLLLLSLLPLLTVSNKSADGSDPAAYATLQSKLGLQSVRELERLVQTAIYAGLVTAHLDPLNQRVAVSSVAALRDLAPMSLPPMVDALAEWEARCDDVLGDIEEQIAGIRRKAAEKQQRQKQHDAVFEAAIKAEEERGSKKGGKRGAPGEDGAMDLDEAGFGGVGGGGAGFDSTGTSSKARGTKRSLRSSFQRL